MSDPLNISSDDAAIFSANTSDDDSLDTEDPFRGPRAGVQKAEMFRAKPPRPKRPRPALPESCVPGPIPHVNLTPGAHQIS